MKNEHEAEIVLNFDVLDNSIVVATLEKNVYVNGISLNIKLNKKSSEVRFLSKNTVLVLERDGAASIITINSPGQATLHKPFFGRSVTLTTSYSNKIADKDGVITELVQLGERTI